MTENEVETALAAEGKNAPRVTPERIDAVIVAEHCFNLGEALRALGHPVSDAFNTVTICALKLANGFTVTGESACASPENFSQEIGSRLAREDARRQVWRLEGYALKTALFEGRA
jgi:hypothetical protein